MPEYRYAEEDDLDVIVSLVNAAYEVETGDTGVSFKKTPRFMDGKMECLPMIVNRNMVVSVDTNTKTILGVIAFEINPLNRTIHFGPLAVSPLHQGRGIAKGLIDWVENHGRINNCTDVVIEVVNHRNDIIPMYEKMKFVKVAEQDFPAPERVTRPCFFYIMKRPIV